MVAIYCWTRLDPLTFGLPTTTTTMMLTKLVGRSGTPCIEFMLFNSKWQLVSACGADSDLDLGSDHRATFAKFCVQSFVKAKTLVII